MSLSTERSSFDFGGRVARLFAICGLCEVQKHTGWWGHSCLKGLYLLPLPSAHFRSEGRDGSPPRVSGCGCASGLVLKYTLGTIWDHLHPAVLGWVILGSGNKLRARLPARPITWWGGLRGEVRGWPVSPLLAAVVLSARGNGRAGREREETGGATSETLM